MNESRKSSTAFKVIHWVVIVLLLLMVAQPTFDNTRALISGQLVMGDVTIDVTITKMALHLIAMVVAWVGFILFFMRKKMGAYITIGGHLLGLVGVMTQTPEMLDVMPPAVIGVFFVILIVAVLTPVLVFKDQYT